MLVNRFIRLFVLLCVLVAMFPGIQVSAKTVNDLKRNLTQLEETAKQNKDKINYTESQITNTKNAINNIYTEIDRINSEIDQKNKEIIQLNKEIEAKDQETKELLQFFQISSGESMYLEYIMGAKSLTDFIYRLSVVEQLSSYNDKLMKEMNDLIVKNEQTKVDLKQKEKELGQKQVELGQRVGQLGVERQKLYEYDRSLEDEIKVAREVINMYVKAGCGNDEEISVCANRLLPPDTRFWRPMTQGLITSDFGYRYHPIYNYKQYHAALDLSNSDRYNTKIYSVASGKVAKVFYDKYGGNQVVVHHRIFNGSSYSNYTSVYLHLAKVLVKDGELVTKETVLGIMGSTGDSTGPHLHLAIATGHRYKDYVSYSDYIAHCINPKSVINFPAYYKYWYNRTTKY